MKAKLSKVPGVKAIFYDESQHEHIYSIVHEAESFQFLVAVIPIASEVHSLPRAGVTTIKYRKS